MTCSFCGLLYLQTFFLSIITSVYGISTYATNRLDLTSIRTMYGDIIRIVFLFGTFLIFKPTLWFIGAASLLSTAYTAFWNRRFTRQLLPQVQMKISNFRWKKVWELVSLGAWNSLTRLGQQLLDGVDILLSGALILDGNASMTMLSLAKMVPTAISSLMGTVVGVFNPQITIAYAEDNTENLVKIIKSCNRILIFIMSIPIAFLTAYGRDFYAMWQPTKDADMLQRLSLLAVGVLYVSMSIQVLYHVFIITKKVKWNSLVILGSGVLSSCLCTAFVEDNGSGSHGISAVQYADRTSAKSYFYSDLCGQMPEDPLEPVLWRYSAGLDFYWQYCDSWKSVPDGILGRFLDKTDSDRRGYGTAGAGLKFPDYS